jgi:hypothetical protein
MAAHIDPQLLARLDTRAATPFDLIVRVERADDDTEQALRDMGFEVRQRMELLPSFAVTGRGPTVLALTQEPWVVAIEEDRPVHAM